MHILVVSEPWRVTLFEQPFNTHLVWSVVPALCSRAPGTINQSVMCLFPKSSSSVYFITLVKECNVQNNKRRILYFISILYPLEIKLKRIYIPFGRKKYCVFDKVIKKEIQFIERIVLRKSF